MIRFLYRKVDCDKLKIFTLSQKAIIEIIKQRILVIKLKKTQNRIMKYTQLKRRQKQKKK